MFRLTSSSSHIPARRATSPAEGNSRAIAGHKQDNTENKATYKTKARRIHCNPPGLVLYQLRINDTSAAMYLPLQTEALSLRLHGNGLGVHALVDRICRNLVAERVHRPFGIAQIVILVHFGVEPKPSEYAAVSIACSARTASFCACVKR